MNEIFTASVCGNMRTRRWNRTRSNSCCGRRWAAPSAFNQQPWEFYVVTNRSLIEQLSTVTPYAGCAKNAPVVIVSAYREQVTLPAYCQDRHEHRV